MNELSERRGALLAEPDGLRWEIDAGAGQGTLIFDRPPLNVVSFAARAQFAAILEELDAHEDVRVIVIRGANGVFSSGGDIAGFQKVPADGMADLARAVAAPERCRKPVIAAIERYAMGVAFEIALACDFRIAEEGAEFALPEIDLGAIPGSGGTQRLARIAGLGRAKEMIMRGRRIGAAEAEAWGLVAETVPAGGLDEAVARWVADLSARPEHPARHPQTGPQRDLRDAALPPVSGAKGQAFEKIRFGEAFTRGIEAFLSKKKPDFSDL